MKHQFEDTSEIFHQEMRGFMELLSTSFHPSTVVVLSPGALTPLKSLATYAQAEWLCTALEKNEAGSRITLVCWGRESGCMRGGAVHRSCAEIMGAKRR